MRAAVSFQTDEHQQRLRQRGHIVSDKTKQQQSYGSGDDDEVEEKAEEKSGGMGEVGESKAEEKAKGPTSRFGRPLPANKNLAGATPLSAWVGYGKEHLRGAQKSGVRASSTKRKNEGGAFAEDSEYDSEHLSSDSESDSDAEEKYEQPPEKTSTGPVTKKPEPINKRKSAGSSKHYKGRAPVSTKQHDRVFQGVLSEKQREAQDRWAKAKELKALPVKKDMRDITLEKAYIVLYDLLTLDGNGNNTLVDNGVYIARPMFKKAVVYKAAEKLVPYNASDYGVKAGIKVILGGVGWTVKSTQHSAVAVEAEGRLDKPLSVLFIVEHAAKGQGVMTLGEAMRKITLFLATTIAIITIHVPGFMKTDGKSSHNANAIVNPGEEVKQSEFKENTTSQRSRKGKDWRRKMAIVEKVNPLIWKILQTVLAAETVRVLPDDVSQDLQEFLAAPGSQLEMAGLQMFKDKEFSFDTGNMGIFGKREMFNPRGTASTRLHHNQRAH